MIHFPIWIHSQQFMDKTSNRNKSLSISNYVLIDDMLIAIMAQCIETIGTFASGYFHIYWTHRY